MAEIDDSPAMAVGHCSVGDVHTLLEQSPYRQSRSAAHLAPTAPLTPAVAEDEMTHLTLESPGIPDSWCVQYVSSVSTRLK